jgi:hypothetical protein
VVPRVAGITAEATAARRQVAEATAARRQVVEATAVRRRAAATAEAGLVAGLQAEAAAADIPEEGVRMVDHPAGEARPHQDRAAGTRSQDTIGVELLVQGRFWEAGILTPFTVRRLRKEPPALPKPMNRKEKGPS